MATLRVTGNSKDSIGTCDDASAGARESGANERGDDVTAAPSIATSPLFVFTQDLDLRYTWGFDPAAGIVPEHLVGATDDDLFPRDAAARLRALKLRAIESGVDARACLDLALGAQVRWYEIGVHPVRDSAGRIAGISGSAVDVTEHRSAEQALRESEQRFLTFMENLPGSAFIRDDAGRYLYANPVATRMHKAPGVWRGKTLDDAFPPPLAAMFKANDRRVLDHNEVLRTVVVTTVDGIERRWLVNKFPLPSASGTRAVGGVGIDITEQIRAEEELRESEAKLRNAVEEREHLFRELHDSVIQSVYATGLSLEECQRLIVERHEPAAVRTLAAAVSALNGVIRDVRGFISGRHAPTITGQQLRDEIADLARTITAAQQLRFRVSVDAAAAAMLSTEQARHVLSIAREAMANSMRHSSARKGSVSLRAHERRVVLEVRDDGVGFDMERMRDRGHGLHNIASRAASLGANLDIRSSPGAGTRIAVDFPRGAV